MLDFIFRWEVVLGTVGVLLTVGVGVLALDDFRIAKVCFGLVATDLAGGIAMWGVTTPLDARLRLLVVGVCFALVGILFVESVRYVDHKRDAKLGKESKADNTPVPVTVSPSTITFNASYVHD